MAKKNGNLADLVLEKLGGKLEEANVSIEEIEELKAISEQMAEINEQVQELIAKRDGLRKRGHEILDRIPTDLRKLLEFLGIVDFKEIVDNLHGGRKTARVRTGGVKRGSGLSGKTIVYQNTEYRQATYFCRKFGITGGLEGLKEWAESEGKTVRVEDDTIYIE